MGDLLVHALVADADVEFASELELALASVPSIEVIGSAGNVEQLVELASSRSADIVFLSAELPEVVDGLDRLRKMTPKLPAVIVMCDKQHPAGAFRRRVIELADAEGGSDMIASFVTKTAETSAMVMLVVALVVLANPPPTDAARSAAL